MKKKQPKPVLAWAHLDERGEILRDRDRRPWVFGLRDDGMTRVPIVRVEIRVVPSKRKPRKKP